MAIFMKCPFKQALAESGAHSKAFKVLSSPPVGSADFDIDCK